MFKTFIASALLIAACGGDSGMSYYYQDDDEHLIPPRAEELGGRPQRSSRDDGNYGSSLILSSNGVGVVNYQTLAEVWSENPRGDKWRVRIQGVNGSSIRSVAMKLEWGVGGVVHSLDTLSAPLNPLWGNMFNLPALDLAFNITAQWVRLSVGLNAVLGQTVNIQGSICKEDTDSYIPLILASRLDTIAAGATVAFNLPRYCSQLKVNPASGIASYPFAVSAGWRLDFAAVGGGEKMEWEPIGFITAANTFSIINNTGVINTYEAFFMLEL